ncbi:MAG: hypothetical protein EF813_05700 [Methanosarcinales archaeon]|nr:MAG: hypothetical protein EF813_05700 [Methanosarcinales archaeon]
MKKRGKTKKPKVKKTAKTEISEEKRAYDNWMQLFACDDPTWKLPKRYVHFQRLMGHGKKFAEFEKQYPDCIDDLMTGVPTYYCVLCVSKNDPPDTIQKAYQRKKLATTYPDEILKRACEMLSDRRKRSDYEEILRLFLKIMQGYSAKEKRELIEEHSEWLEDEKERATEYYLSKNRSEWFNLCYMGAPTFYELLGVNRAKLTEIEKVKRNNKDVDTRLTDEICKILNNPQLRFEYDYVLDITGEILPEYSQADDKSRKPTGIWNDVGYLMTLRHYNDVAKYDHIRTMHEDWGEYLDDKTFYNVLTLDKALVPEDKREAEGFIRNAYRSMKRTPEVNLAYSVLKNFNMREDYNWLLKNQKTVDMLIKIGAGKMDDKTKDEIIAIMDATRE